MSKTLVVGVTGGIAAYKAADLVSALTQSGYNVQVIMTEAAMQMVGSATFRSLSKNPVATSLFADPQTPVPHISLAQAADLMVIAPATADTIGKIANGIADDLLTTTVMACVAPKLIVPAMNEQMWQNPIVQENITKLKKYGYVFVDPGTGYLACGMEGQGRYPENTAVITAIEKLLKKNSEKLLQGKKIIITGGGTKESIDPVRVITNRSSGKMGLALKQAAEAKGAEVIYIEADTIENLKNNIEKDYKNADVLIMAAAVSDYRPIKASSNKIKSKTDKILLELEKTEDVLAYFGNKKQKQFLVGFALESEDLEKNAKTKLKNKNLDLIIANSTEAIGAEKSSIIIIDKKGQKQSFNNLDKKILAEKILDTVCRSIS